MMREGYICDFDGRRRESWGKEGLVLSFIEESFFFFLQYKKD